VRSGCFKK
jgi:hypothetical protein